MKRIRSALFDIDGTLIEGGRLDSVKPEVGRAVRRLREEGVLFCLASGRPYFEQEGFHHRLVDPTHSSPDSSAYKLGEAILYEGSCIRLLGGFEAHRLGGLTHPQLVAIEAFIREKKIMEGMVPQANNLKYETTTGFVTPTFISEGRTDSELLERTYERVRDILEAKFPYVEVVMSADAIDINAKGVTKGPPTIKYAQLNGITLDQIAAVGDSGNDMPMLKVVGEAGGLVVYVGKRPEQEEVVRQYPHHFIPLQRGPLGTVEGIEYILQFNGGL